MSIPDRILTPETAEQIHGIPAATIRRWLRRGLRHQFDSPKGEPDRHWFTESALFEFCREQAAREERREKERLTLAKPSAGGRR